MPATDGDESVRWQHPKARILIPTSGQREASLVGKGRFSFFFPMKAQVFPAAGDLPRCSAPQPWLPFQRPADAVRKNMPVWESPAVPTAGGRSVSRNIFNDLSFFRALKFKKWTNTSFSIYIYISTIFHGSLLLVSRDPGWASLNKFDDAVGISPFVIIILGDTFHHARPYCYWREMSMVAALFSLPGGNGITYRVHTFVCIDDALYFQAKWLFEGAV